MSRVSTPSLAVPNKKKSQNSTLSSGLLGIFSNKKKLHSSSSSAEPVTIHSFEDLPKEVKDHAKNMDVSPAELGQHLDTFLSIVGFIEKKRFILVSNKPKQEIPLQKSEKLSALRKVARERITEVVDVKKQYKFADEAGTGAFGTVFDAKNMETGERVALKKLVHLTDQQKNINELEVGCLISFTHPNILKFIDVFSNQNDLWLVTEYLQGGPLSRAIESTEFTEYQIGFMMKQILSGIEFLHKNDIIHRDIKSSNLMISVKAELKIIDMGMCCDSLTGQRGKLCGSPMWTAPEVIRQEPYSYLIDIWGFGVVLLELINNKFLHKIFGWKYLFQNAVHGFDKTWLSQFKTSNELKEVVDNALEFSPENRASATKLLSLKFFQTKYDPSCLQEVLTMLYLTDTLKKLDF
eukprot:TRINITY_DN5611_c0_g1_i1.p1 TRINITY_DN5611_c0_g1~~TRINITY_DN5611_c0_g1_i1.p1  ORF type:complete len:408 (-),score=60.19 TRINITY_DN5611_c0_g1_i1:59-1282(-)